MTGFDILKGYKCFCMPLVCTVNKQNYEYTPENKMHLHRFKAIAICTYLCTYL